MLIKVVSNLLGILQQGELFILVAYVISSREEAELPGYPVPQVISSLKEAGVFLEMLQVDV